VLSATESSFIEESSNLFFFPLSSSSKLPNLFYKYWTLIGGDALFTLNIIIVITINSWNESTVATMITIVPLSSMYKFKSMMAGVIIARKNRYLKIAKSLKVCLESTYYYFKKTCLMYSVIAEYKNHPQRITHIAILPFFYLKALLLSWEYAIYSNPIISIMKIIKSNITKKRDGLFIPIQFPSLLIILDFFNF